MIGLQDGNENLSRGGVFSKPDPGSHSARGVGGLKLTDGIVNLEAAGDLGDGRRDRRRKRDDSGDRDKVEIFHFVFQAMWFGDFAFSNWDFALQTPILVPVGSRQRLTSSPATNEFASNPV